MCTRTALGGARVHVKLDNWHLLKSSLGTLIVVLTSAFMTQTESTSNVLICYQGIIIGKGQ